MRKKNILIQEMFDLSSITVRALIAVVVIILGVVLIKYFSTDKEESITEYAAPVKPTLKGILKSPRNLVKKLESIPPASKQVSWGPSAVDTVMVPNGEFDTNRFPDSFVTNVASGGFPADDEGGFDAARKTKWTPEYPQNFAVSSLTAMNGNTLVPEPALGLEDPFATDFGSV
ncbi:hypothetical protein ATCV1_Z619L [Acanthocystis turfacea chlorella virus 1]|uniref:Uncharacterized protein Z619L n=1 Tax=Chlorovirus heliozoae TaxID=322019 RepID=A7K9M9_9PHYC|nr:hypothetical protein ATCV1_Z619L [Acanthocystis turfacea chlorella virus 1]ABT16753.1 hypothetical protein ATCV1_Z619L [Acanthocystis turfacea chlorella virus 1]AGE60191.1 hypothetical protein ATCVWI0606_725L [Acanthocystis turfacea Chlorella virus WI0606]